MKTLSIALMVLLLTFGAAFGQEFYPTNQKTVAWDVAENANLYRVFVRPVPAGEAVKVGEVAETVFTVTVPAEGKWLIGIQSVRVEETVVVGESTDKFRFLKCSLTTSL